MTQPVDDQNAYDVLLGMLRDWGLESLGPEVLRMLQDGYTQNQIPILLQDTDAYKQRFAGNQVRRANGLSVLSPAEYLQVERSYRQVLSQAGLPPGFYDQASDFTKWIGGDVSPMEVQHRADEAIDAAYRADDNTKAVWSSMGIQPMDMVGWILDGDRGRAELNRIVHGGRIAGAAAGYGVGLSLEDAMRYGEMTTEDYVQQSQQFGRVAGEGQRLGNIYAGQNYTAEDAAAEVLGQNAEAERKRKRLEQREISEFSGNAGSRTGSLASGPGGY